MQIWPKKIQLSEQQSLNFTRKLSRGKFVIFAENRSRATSSKLQMMISISLLGQYFLSSEFRTVVQGLSSFVTSSIRALFLTTGIISPTSDEQTSLSHVLHRKVQKMFLHLYHDLSFQCDMEANVLAIYERWGQETQGEKKLADPNWGSLIVTDSDIIRTSGLVTPAGLGRCKLADCAISELKD